MHLSYDHEIQHFGQVFKQFLLKKLGWSKERREAKGGPTKMGGDIGNDAS